MPICGIYKITNQLNGHAYIGLSIDIERRWKEHRKMKYRACIYDAFVKYGIDNFKFTILEECQKDKLNEQEKYWIAYYNTYKNSFNYLLIIIYISTWQCRHVFLPTILVE